MTSQVFFVSGPLPGQNEIIAAAKGARGTGRIYSAMKKTWTDRVAWAAKAARLRPVECATFDFRWVEGSQRRDMDNVRAAAKFVLDGLVAAKVLPNDGWKQVAGFSDSFEVGEKPGVWVTIIEVD